MARDEGGPAFPAQPIYEHPGGATSMSSQNGMTLRDYFAGRALVAMDAWTPQIDLDHTISYGSAEWHVKARQARAEYAYAQADAMLAERAK